MVFLSTAIIVFLIMIAIFLYFEIIDHVAIFISIVFSIFVGILFERIVTDNNNTRIQSCKEESQLIVPMVSYANDSSFKTLKYEHNKIERKIRIQKSDSLFTRNDSEYIIEPCEETVLKRSR